MLKSVACLIAGVILAAPAALLAQAPPSPQASTPQDRLKFEAEQAYQNGDFAKCIELTGRVLSGDPKDHVALYLRASARVELGQLQGSLKEVRAGIEDAREAMRSGGTEMVNYYLPYFYGMTALSQMERRPEHAAVVFDFAAQVLKRANLKPDERANLLYQRATAGVYLQKYTEASADFTAAAELVPTHLGARLGLGDVYVRQNQMDKAEAAFTAAVQAVPDNPLVYNNRGMFFQNTGKPVPAQADFTKAIELDPTYTVAYTNRGFSQMSQGKPVEAEADFSASLKVDPAQPMVYGLRGTARLARGEPQLAAADYQESLRLNPQNPLAQADLGFAKYFAGDYAGAVAALDAAVATDANLRYLNPWRFWAAVKAGQPPAAAASKLGGATSKAADQRDWIDQLSVFLSGGINDVSLLAAVEQKDEALKKAQLCEAYYFQAEAKARAGDKAGATALYEQSLATGQTHLSAYRGSQYALGKFAPK